MRTLSPDLPAAARLFLVAFTGLVVAAGVTLALTWPEQRLPRYELEVRGDDDCLRADGGAR